MCSVVHVLVNVTNKFESDSLNAITVMYVFWCWPECDLRSKHANLWNNNVWFDSLLWLPSCFGFYIICIISASYRFIQYFYHWKCITVRYTLSCRCTWMYLFYLFKWNVICGRLGAKVFYFQMDHAPVGTDQLSLSYEFVFS